MGQAASIATDVRERIFRIASMLYQQNGGQAFPALDEVCRLAAVDMNTAGLVCREWRMQQRASVEPLAEQLPVELKERAGLALDRIWQHAQQQANYALQSAQSAWQDEMKEQLGLHQELALLYEKQAGELAAMRQQLSVVLALHAQPSVPEAGLRFSAQPSSVDPGRDESQALRQALHEAQSRLAEVEQQARQQHQQWQQEGDSLRHTLQQLEEEVRILRSDKESAYRAVASLRQQLQQSKQGGNPATEDEAARLARLEAAAFNPSLPGPLSPASESAGRVWKAR